MVAEGATVGDEVHTINGVPRGMLVLTFIKDRLKIEIPPAAIAGKALYRASEGKVVVPGKKLQFYKDDEGDKTVSFILQPPPIATHRSDAAGVPSAGGSNDCTYTIATR
jgi:hypothetical protein